MQLKKGIRFWGVFSIASGAMISSGIFVLPGLAFAKAALFQTIVVIGLLLSIILYIILGIKEIDLSYYKPFLTVEVNEILVTSGFILSPLEDC